MDTLSQHYRSFALYNRWANREVYRVASECTAEDLDRDRGAFFKSILGTLNHMLVADEMWLSRMKGASPRGTRLDEMRFTNLAELLAARQDHDSAIIDYVFSLSEAQVVAPLCYQTTSGAEQWQPLQQVLAHFFNHQTHHRGQLHDLLGQTLGAARAPVLDLLYYQRLVAPNDRSIERLA